MLYKVLIIIIFFTSNSIFSQKNVLSTGSTISGSGGSASYSVGQIDFKYYSTTNGNVSEGVQHPQEVLTLSINDFDNFSFNVFPNPVIDFLIISTDQDLNANYIIFDTNGKEISKGIIKETSHKIDFQSFSNGIYLLNIFSDSKLKKQYKLIKSSK